MKCKCLYDGVRALAVVQSAVSCLCAWLSLSGDPLLCGLHASTPSFWMSQLQQAICSWMGCSACALEPNTILDIKRMHAEILCLQFYEHKYWKPMQTSWCALMSVISVCLLALILKFKIYIFAEIIHNCFGKYSNWFWVSKLQLKKKQPKTENLLFLLLLLLFPEPVEW